MRPALHELNPAWEGERPREPFRKLPRQQFPKQLPDRNTGIIVSFPPNSGFPPLVVSNFGTVQRQFHEFCERNCPFFGNFCPQNSSDLCAHPRLSALIRS